MHEGKDLALAWHRRAGKDEVLLNGIAVKALQRPASYAYMFPENLHARRAMWQSVNPHTGRRRILESFVPELLDGEPNETDMRLKLVNGSQILFFGSDNYDRMVGAALAGIVSSEHALSNPSAYAFFSPMLLENNGFFWAISTPRGRNHFKDLIDYAKTRPSRWYQETLSVAATGAISDEDLEEEREKYVALYGEDQGEAFFQQEYFVDFNAAILGAFYAREMAAVRKEGRIDEIEAVEGQPVHRAWDIGVRDDTSIWWFQVVGSQIYILDCYSRPGESDIEVFAEMIHRKDEEMGWTSGKDYVPHDARQKVWGMKRGRLETMADHGLNPEVVPPLSKLDGINAVRRTLPRCVFHPRCEEVGIPALEQYRREWDDERKTFKANEVHDWSSHLADAFRYLSVTWQPAAPPKAEKPKPIYAVEDGYVLAPALPGERRRY